jgi:hypothetical protein
MQETSLVVLIGEVRCICTEIYKTYACGSGCFQLRNPFIYFHWAEKAAKKLLGQGDDIAFNVIYHFNLNT